MLGEGPLAQKRLALALKLVSLERRDRQPGVHVEGALAQAGLGEAVAIEGHRVAGVPQQGAELAELAVPQRLGTPPLAFIEVAQQLPGALEAEGVQGRPEDAGQDLAVRSRLPGPLPRHHPSASGR